MSKMRSVVITIKTDNAAFDEDNFCIEVSNILKKLANNAEYGNLEGTIRDSNGNNVGDVKMIYREEK